MRTDYTIDYLDRIKNRANAIIAEDYREYGWANPPVVSIGIIRAVLRAIQCIDEERDFSQIINILTHGRGRSWGKDEH